MTTFTKSGRPKMRVPLQPLDYLLEGLGLLSLLLMIGLSVFHYNNLPATIPIHFGADGQPDQTGAKTTLWILPVLGAIVFGLLTLINRFPYYFNYMVNITPENAEHQFTMATRLIRFMKMLTIMIFTFITWRTIQIANGGVTGLGPNLLILPGLILGLTIYYIYQSVSKQ